MKIYFAGAEAFSGRQEIISALPRALVSYWSVKTRPQILKLLHDNGIEIFMDSGGFSVMTKGISIEAKDYGKFLLDNQQYITTYANLDTFKFEESKENQKYLESIGLKPIPVFHAFDKGWEKDFEKMIADYDYIALGGVAIERSRLKKLNYLSWAFTQIEQIKPDVKVHGFGINSFDFALRFPFYSVDSTSWIVPAKFKTFAKIPNIKRKGLKAHNSFKIATNKGMRYKLLGQQITYTLKMEKVVTDYWENKRKNG